MTLLQYNNVLLCCSTFMTEKSRKLMGDQSTQLALAVGYDSAGKYTSKRDVWNYWVRGSHGYPDVLEFEYVSSQSEGATVLELMAVFVNILDNVISMLQCISPNFWPYELLVCIDISNQDEIYLRNYQGQGSHEYPNVLEFEYVF